MVSAAVLLATSCADQHHAGARPGSLGMKHAPHVTRTTQRGNRISSMRDSRYIDDAECKRKWHNLSSFFGERRCNAKSRAVT